VKPAPWSADNGLAATDSRLRSVDISHLSVDNRQMSVDNRQMSVDNRRMSVATDKCPSTTDKCPSTTDECPWTTDECPRPIGRGTWSPFTFTRRTTSVPTSVWLSPNSTKKSQPVRSRISTLHPQFARKPLSVNGLGALGRISSASDQGSAVAVQASTASVQASSASVQARRAAAGVPILAPERLWPCPQVSSRPNLRSRPQSLSAPRFSWKRKESAETKG